MSIKKFFPSEILKNENFKKNERKEVQSHGFYWKTLCNKLIHWKQLDDLQKKCNIKKGQLLYCIEYMKKKVPNYVNVGKMLHYCDKRREKDTNGKQKCYRDNSRAFEIFRKDKVPLEWDEFKDKHNNLHIKYNPSKKKDIVEKICRNDKFNKSIIKEKLELANYKCSITGIPKSNGDLAADHFIPKEKGGKSTIENCIIINKILNEKKNNKMPIPWFCESLLTNFMNICKNVGILEECKKNLIEFINNF